MTANRRPAPFYHLSHFVTPPINWICSDISVKTIPLSENRQRFLMHQAFLSIQFLNWTLKCKLLI